MAKEAEIRLRKQNTFWNMVYSLINAAQSALLLIIVNRICFEEKAGVFSYAFSVAVLFMYIGSYGIRNFQVSDTAEKYTPGQYYAARLFTVAIMVACGAVYAVAGDFTPEKAGVVAALILTKAAEALEDVFHGRYQQLDKLYVACRQGSVRFFLSDIAFTVVLLFTKDLVLASYVYFGVNMIFTLVFAWTTLPAFGGFSLDFKKMIWGKLLAECFPLFLNYFFITFLANVSKYALDRYGHDVMQAHWGMIFMPVFVINLLSTLIFRPVITTMARMYTKKRFAAYMDLVHRQEKWIALISILVLIPAYFIGLPVLGFVYASNLSGYFPAFILLMIGGIFSAYSSFYNVCIVTLRGQKRVLYATAVTAVVSAILHFWLLSMITEKWMVTMAAAVFLLSMLLQMMLYLRIHKTLFKKACADNKPEVGILTVYSFNYGSFFQATSLYKKVQEMGYSCEFINERFKRKQWGNLALLYTFHDLLPESLRKWLSGKLPQYLTFLRLREDVASFRESDPDEARMYEITKGYDLVLLGADELWSASPKSIRYTPAYFGHGITAPHSAYATCGSLFDMEDEALCEKARAGIKTFEHVAVRDGYTAKVAEKLWNREEVPVVLDPTLLHPWFVEDCKTITPRIEVTTTSASGTATSTSGTATSTSEKASVAGGPYILLYGSEYSEPQRAFIKKKAIELGASVYAMGWPQDFADGFLDPEDALSFQRAFADAAFVVPATFHGTIFSILHHRPFVTAGNALRGVKIGELLKQLELTDRLFDETKAENNEYGDIDYTALEEHLDVLRKESEAYLQKVLSEHVFRVDVTGEGKESCTGCRACAHICPVSAISMQEDEEGFCYPVIDAEKCVHCDLCRENCPSRNPLAKVKGEFFGAAASDDTKRLSASSGGAYGALAEAIFAGPGATPPAKATTETENKAIAAVYGAAFDEDFRVRHTKAENAEELAPHKGSKYVAGTVDVYEEVLRDLKDGKEVLFSGTPCEVAGMKAYIEKKCSTLPNGETLTKNLYLADIVCHGLPSPKIFETYLRIMEEKNGSPVSSVNFRNKEKGWSHQCLELKFENGERYLSATDRDPYYILYFANLCDRPSCHSCPYASFERISDLTLGDYWGNEDSAHPLKDPEKGVSLILANTEKGKALLTRASEYGFVKTQPGDERTAFQPVFDHPTAKGARRDAFWREVRLYGVKEAALRFGKLSAKEKIVKRVIAPLTKKLGIYKFAQKIYFGRH